MKALTSIKGHQSPKNCQNKVLLFPGLSAFKFLKSISQNKLLLFQIKFDRKVQSSKIKMTKQNQKNWFNIYQWRNNTGLPIVKTYYITIIQQNLQNTQIEVFNEYLPYRLSDYAQIPLIQIIYLIKQSMIGFERLFSKFGGFQINCNMVGISENKKCKVWMNENYQTNTPKKAQIDEIFMVQRITDMFSSFVARNELSKQFFEKLREQKKFIQVFKFIDSFNSKNNLLIPYRINLEPNKLKILQFKQSNRVKVCLNQEQNQSENNYQSLPNIQIQTKQKIPKQRHFMKAQTQFDFQMKEQKEISIKANSNKQMLFSFIGKQVDADDQDFNQQISDVTTPNTPDYKKQNNNKNESVFKSDINVEGHSYEKVPKKERKFSTYNNSSKQYSNRIVSLNSIRETVEEKIDSKKNIELIQIPLKRGLLTANTSNQYSMNNQPQQYQDILKKNGWEDKFNKLLNNHNIDQIKQSVTIGQDIRSKQSIKLEKLGGLGRDIADSMMNVSSENEE